MLITQTYTRNEKKHHFLLDGLLVCYECKHKIGVRAGKNGTYSMVCNNYRRNSKLGLCTSHGFNYNNLENTVLQYIKALFKDVNAGKIELNVKNNMNKNDYSRLINNLEKEIKKINNNIDKMYVDKLNNKISEEMYNRLFSKMIEEIKTKENEYKELKTKKENNLQDDMEKIRKLINEFLKLEEPTPEIMKTLINKIEIHQNKQVDIIFNFKQLCF